MTRRSPGDERASRPPADPAGGGDRRERLLEVSARLFAERGVKNVTVRDVAAEAGVTHPLIYYYWPSKEHLLAAAVENAQRRVDRAAAGESDALDGVVSIARESLEHNRQYLQTLTRALLDGMPPSEWPGGYPGIEAALRLLTTEVEPGSDADIDARERLACAVAMLLGWSLIEDQLLSMVGLPAGEHEHARATLLASIRQVLEQVVGAGERRSGQSASARDASGT